MEGEALFYDRSGYWGPFILAKEYPIQSEYHGPYMGRFSRLLSVINEGVESRFITKGKVILMAKKANSLAHIPSGCVSTTLMFTPKYRRKIVYNQYKESIRDIIKQMCGYKGKNALMIFNKHANLKDKFGNRHF